MRWEFIDKQLVEEEISDEELQDLVLEAQREILARSAEERTHQKPKRPFPRWLFWLISIVFLVNTFAVFFEVYSIPVIDFLKISSKLSAQQDIATYKKSVVLIETADGRGTGFSISSDGTILTNYHVIDGNKTVTISFPESGRFIGKVVHTYPEIDLAVVKVSGDDLPFLTLAANPTFVDNESIKFIGNPIGFTGIANEGNILEDIQLKDWEVPVIMMKAPVYKGNSGSPVLNKDGKVIGVVFATLRHDTHGNVGLFVPINEYYKAIRAD